MKASQEITYPIVPDLLLVHEGTDPFILFIRAAAVVLLDCPFLGSPGAPFKSLRF
jgi:hypothetical protein